MPLSDEEARMLAQLEESLAAEDPEFASTLRGSKLLARTRRTAVLAAIGFVAGLAVLFTGAVTATTWLGVLGFVAMLASAYVFSTAWTRGQAVRQGEAGAPGRPGPAKQRGSSFVDRMEERWQRRQDNDDFG